MKKKDREFEELKKREMDERLNAAAYDLLRVQLTRLKAELETENRLKYEAYYFIMANGQWKQFEDYCRSVNLKELTDYLSGIELRFTNVM